MSITVNGMSINTLTLSGGSEYDEACSLFDSGRMGRVRVVTDAIHVNDNTIVMGINLKGVTKIGVSNVQVYSIRKDLLNGQQKVTSDSQVDQVAQSTIP